MLRQPDNDSVAIRTAGLSDARELLDIYAPYVAETAISFEYETPGLEEFKTRIANISQKYPYLVAERGGEILGYAYTHAFVGRAAYDWSAETTIYLRRGNTGIGIGRLLYETLEQISKAQRILNLYACVGYPEIEDEHLTKNSVQFHEHMGYRTVGTFRNCGYKFDTWYHMVWMEKLIGEPAIPQPPVIPFPLLGDTANHICSRAVI